MYVAVGPLIHFKYCCSTFSYRKREDPINRTILIRNAPLLGVTLSSVSPGFVFNSLNKLGY